MQKGQFSFDVIFAIIFLMLSLQLLLPIIDSAGESYNRTIIRKQERAIGRELAGVIDSVRGHEGMEVEYIIPEIYAAGKRAAIGCDIDIEDTLITVSVRQGHLPELADSGIIVISSEVETNNNIGGYSVICGETITINGETTGATII